MSTNANNIWPANAEVLSTIPDKYIDMVDRILSVSKHTHPPSSIVLRLRKLNKTEYGIAIKMPSNLVQKASRAIKSGMSLADVAMLGLW